MQWQDEAIVLAARPHGEASIIVQLLTRSHGRHAGLVRGGKGARLRGTYQAGNLVSTVWSGRLAEHLGSFECELTHSYAATVLDDPDRLAALVASTAICEAAMPEREPHQACFEGLLALLIALEGDHWAELYVRWEMGLLAELGFGLDLSRCAGGGDNDQLVYVSPKSGRAVSLSAGAPYKDRLLPLPGFLLGLSDGGMKEVSEGLALTGFFMERHLFHPNDKTLPKARERLAERFAASVDDRRGLDGPSASDQGR